ncbi:hypothetical protein [Oryzifoliimicrobium ureilyticus]|uniref:hypothetical protein n=1 Tax=Oryzifoliimicrobium ureilyticus TaxID=3113724 RepID=UPI00307655F0
MPVRIKGLKPENALDFRALIPADGISQLAHNSVADRSGYSDGNKDAKDGPSDTLGGMGWLEHV